MKLRYSPKHADRGATLIIVLIIVTVISMVIGVILSQADTNVRSTVHLRDKAANDYGADGATQAMLNALKSSGINCNDPNSPYGVTLGSSGSPFYSPVSSEQGPLNAYARCTADPIIGKAYTTTTSTPPPTTSVTTVTPPPVTSTAPYLGAGDPSLPTYAVLTTGNSAGDFGLDVSPSAGSNTTIYVENGSVGSNTDINATGLCLNVRLSGTGTTGCGSGTGVDSGTGTRLVVKAERNCIGGANAFRPTACEAGASDVAAPAPPSPPAVTLPLNPTAQCLTVGTGGNAKTYAALSPGVYTNVSLLNSPCSKPVDWEWLTPGAYYFDYGSTPWQWPSRLIGGTPLSGSQPITTLANLSTANSSPGACDDPASRPSGVNGVSLMFGGSSTVAANTAPNTAAEICASSPNGPPPLAMYALTQSTSVSLSGGGSRTIPAESIGTASLIDTSFTNNNGHAQIYIKGYVYAPTVQMVLRLENSSGQVFNWGVIVRDLRLRLNGSSPTQPVFDLPKPNTGVGTIVTTTTPPAYPSTTVSQPPTVTSTSTYYTIRYVNVWICTVNSSPQQTSTPPCPTTMSDLATSGQPNVQVRIQTDADGVPQKVLSWNNIR